MDYCHYYFSDSIVEESRKAYQQAFDLAIGHMLPTDPIRLGLVLNFSVFYFGKPS